MLTPVAQRWREQRGTYRPAGETIRKREYDVAPVSEHEAKAFVLRHHYLQSFPAARRSFGLYRRGELVGVSVFSQGLNHAATVKEIPGPANLSVTLGRLVLLDEVPGNAESYFIRWSFWHLDQEGFIGVASFSDPLRIVAADGTVTHRGHIGNIYQATNGCYRGRARAEWKLVLPDGRYFQNDSLTKIRHLKEGWRYSARILADLGAPMLDPTKGDPVAWLREQLPKYTRRVKHPGNHKYLWTLNRRYRDRLPPSEPYPKFQLEPRS